MMLPQGVEVEKAPKPGHAPSAPVNPRLRRKCLWTTGLAILPTLLIYFLSSAAKAEETIYRVSDGCKEPVAHVASADVTVRDGYGTGNKQVKPADLEPSGAVTGGDIAIPIEIPAQNYVDRQARFLAEQNAAQGNAGATHRTPTSIYGRNVDLSHSFITAGEVTVSRDGQAYLNGRSIAGSHSQSGDCSDFR